MLDTVTMYVCCALIAISGAVMAYAIDHNYRHPEPGTDVKQGRWGIATTLGLLAIIPLAALVVWLT